MGGMTRSSVATSDTTPLVTASLGDLAAYFTRMGFTAVGGPAAHIAMLEQDLVEQRRWMTRQHFLDTLAATQLVPGPNSTEMVIHIGYTQRGVPGMLVAGACFMLPALLLVLAIGVGYVAFGALPQVGALFYGIQPVIVAIIVHAAYRLGRSICQRISMIVLAVAAALLTLFSVLDTVWVLVVGGLVGVALEMGAGLARVRVLLLLPFVAEAGVGAVARAASEAKAPLWEMALFFLKVGATMMGSGYVLISYMEYDLVEGKGWLTHQELIDAIAVGQMTPGPMFTTAGFVGYINQAGPGGDVVAGLVGGVICALAIFLPSFFIVFLIAPWIPRLRQSRIAGAFLNGVNAAVVGSIAATTWTLFRAAVLNLETPIWTLAVGGSAVDMPALAVLAVAIVVLMRTKVNSALLIAAGALVGLLLQSVF
jgi:chromate transporter